IGFQDLPGADLIQRHFPPVHKLGAGGNKKDLWFCLHLHREYSSGKKRPDTIWGNEMVLGKQKLSGHDVFSNLSDILKWKYRGFDPDPVFPELLNPLDHDDGVGLFWKNVTCIDVKRILADKKVFWFGFTGAVCGLCF